MGAPNRVVTLVHTPDEPLDIVRELGVMLDCTGLDDVYRALVNSLNADRTAQLRRHIERTRRRGRPITLSVENAFDDIHRQLDRRAHRGGGESHRAACHAGETLMQARSGRPLDWRQWSAELTKAGVRPYSWPSVLVATQYIEHDVPGATCLITESGRERWLAGLGTLAEDLPGPHRAGTVVSPDLADASSRA
jgi:hypothetical protein